MYGDQIIIWSQAAKKMSIRELNEPKVTLDRLRPHHFSFAPSQVLSVEM